MPSASKHFFYHACLSDITHTAIKRSLDAVQAVADDNGVDISNENLELWVKPDWYLVGVAIGYDDADERSHRAQMEADGWTRRV
ncbi:hypothetical protein J4U00_gp108 [Mycobacterium phage DyoEdafos]|uniref:Uncharacterized protein n=1 Tax=Mycobacterium phage DyoEdafos TaxID=2599860 RepID=A0A5J6THZ3_9CAUD|nr:hypothetical protein J4U00_gp108 [Mycobacterium phage DyoEdafos]QFG10335.1 hypothetical protein SEA_DYOEDAFOS_108 [Mycobacterium phage DyoEdafos]